VADGVGGAGQNSHHVVGADVLSHCAGVLGPTQKLAQGLDEGPEDGSLADLQADAIGGQQLDDVAFLCPAGVTVMVCVGLR
jgi:hypothetical protein